MAERSRDRGRPRWSVPEADAAAADGDAVQGPAAHPLVGLGVALASAAAFATSGAFGKSLLVGGWSPGAVVTMRVTLARPRAARCPPCGRSRGRWRGLAAQRLGRRRLRPDRGRRLPARLLQRRDAPLRRRRPAARVPRAHPHRRLALGAPPAGPAPAHARRRRARGRRAAPRPRCHRRREHQPRRRPLGPRRRGLPRRSTSCSPTTSTTTCRRSRSPVVASPSARRPSGSPASSACST